MVTLRNLALGDALALTRIYSGASVRYTTGQALALDEAREKIQAALSRAAENPRAQWSWSILHEEEMIGLISVRRRTESMGTLSYILREDAWGQGCATAAVRQVAEVAVTTTGLARLEAMHHPGNPASGRVLTKTGFAPTGTYDHPDHDGTVLPYPTYALRLRPAG